MPFFNEIARSRGRQSHPGSLNFGQHAELCPHALAASCLEASIPDTCVDAHVRALKTETLARVRAAICARRRGLFSSCRRIAMHLTGARIIVRPIAIESAVRGGGSSHPTAYYPRSSVRRKQMSSEVRQPSLVLQYYHQTVACQRPRQRPRNGLTRGAHARCARRSQHGALKGRKQAAPPSPGNERTRAACDAGLLSTTAAERDGELEVSSPTLDAGNPRPRVCRSSSEVSH